MMYFLYFGDIMFNTDICQGQTKIPTDIERHDKHSSSRKEIHAMTDSANLDSTFFWLILRTLR